MSEPAGRASQAPLLIRNAELGGRRRSVRIGGGRVLEMGAGLVARPGEEVVEGGGGALLPGLHDHHLHLWALAATERSVPVGPPSVRDLAGLSSALRHAAREAPDGSWIRAVGYHESVAGPLDRWVLDRLVADRPVRVQDRSGALWVLSSAGAAAVGLSDVGDVDGVERRDDGVPTGRLWRLDGWLRERLPAEPLDLASAARRLLRTGVTGMTDATPTEDHGALRLLARARRGGDVPQRVLITGGPALAPDVVPDLERGPVKLLPPDHVPPVFDQLLAGIRAARAQGRAVAVHCVTAASAALAVAAIEEIGPHPGDRIEHGAVVPVELADRVAGLGITVVTNPGFVVTRGDRYLAEVDAVDQPDLWRCRSLLARGVPLGGGTDAPFGDPDPWTAIAAAITRRTAAGQSLGPDEGLSPSQALALFLSPLERPGGPPRRLDPGVAADLCLLAGPLAEALADPARVEVVATVVGGALHRW